MVFSGVDYEFCVYFICKNGSSVLVNCKLGTVHMIIVFGMQIEGCCFKSPGS